MIPTSELRVDDGGKTGRALSSTGGSTWFRIIFLGQQNKNLPREFFPDFEDYQWCILSDRTWNLSHAQFLKIFTVKLSLLLQTPNFFPPYLYFTSHFTFVLFFPFLFFPCFSLIFLLFLSFLPNLLKGYREVLKSFTISLNFFFCFFREIVRIYIYFPWPDHSAPGPLHPPLRLADLSADENYKILIIFVDFHVSLSRFFCYQDPDPRYLDPDSAKWYRSDRIFLP